MLAAAVLLLRNDGRVRYANPAAENLFELSRAKLVGHTPRALPVGLDDRVQLRIVPLDSPAQELEQLDGGRTARSERREHVDGSRKDADTVTHGHPLFRERQRHYRPHSTGSRIRPAAPAASRALELGHEGQQGRAR